MKFSCKLIILSLLTVFTLTACSKGDAEVEKKLDGTWVAQYYDAEEGLNYHEELNLNADDHTFKMKIAASDGYQSLVFSFGGEWSADKEYLTFEVDEDSFSVSGDSYVSDDEIKAGFLAETDNGQIKQKLSLTDDGKLKLTYDGDTTEYEKK